MPIQNLIFYAALGLLPAPFVLYSTIAKRRKQRRKQERDTFIYSEAMSVSVQSLPPVRRMEILPSQIDLDMGEEPEYISRSLEEKKRNREYIQRIIGQ